MSDADAFPDQRQAHILQMLNEHGRVLCADAARTLGVSEHTVRRDLQALAVQGLCKKVYGGAVSQLKESATFDIRVQENRHEKSSVARKCASLIQPGSCIFIDASSTYLAMADFIPKNLGLTIVTNSPQIAATFSGRQADELILLGGRVDPRTGSTLGTDAVNKMRDIIFDQAFIGVCGLDPQAGLSAVCYEDACFKKEIIAQSTIVIAATTDDKLTQVARYKVAACEDIDIIVLSAQARQLDFSEAGTRIDVAD